MDCKRHDANMMKLLGIITKIDQAFTIWEKEGGNIFTILDKRFGIEIKEREHERLV